MSQQFALRPLPCAAWVPSATLADEVDAVLLAMSSPRRDDHDVLTDDLTDEVDLGRIYLC